MSDHSQGRTMLDAEEPPASGPGQSLAPELAQALVQSSLDGILAFDRELRYTLWNPAMERMSGVPARRVLGHVAFEVFPFLLELGEDQAFREALAGRHVVTRNRPFTIPETDHRGFFEGSYSPLRDASGAIVGGLGVIRDVTERMQVEAARFEAEETGRKLSLLAEVGRELSSSLDFDQMLQRLAGLVVPELADYAIVDVFTEAGDVRRAAVAHRTAAGRALMLDLQRYPPNLGATTGTGLVLRTGEPILAPQVTESQIRPAARDKEHFRLLAQLAPKSSIIVPLLAHGRVLGALALALTEGDRRYGSADLALAEEMAQRAALALDNARLFEAARRARYQAESAARRTAFLAEAGAVLASSLDYATTFARVSDLAVPRLADWCVIDLLEPDGSLRRIRTGKVDPARMELAEELQRRYPFDPTAPGGLARVLRSGQPEFYPEITEEMLASTARDPEHLRMLRGLRFTSVIMVPLLARDRVLGAVTLISAESGQRYGPEDLVLVRELAARAAIAMENARLYQEAQDAARRLEDNVALLDALLVSAPVGIAFLDRELRFARINAVMAELMGIDSAAAAGHPYREVLPDLASQVGHLQRVLEMGEPVTGLEASGETPAAPGKRRHFLANYYPIRSRDGSTAGMGAAVVEITERKRAEEALRETNQTLRALIQSCPLAVMVLEPENGTVQLWNPASERIFGWTEDEVLGHPLPIVPADQLEEFRRHLQALQRGESLLGVETVRQTRDGSLVDVSLWVAPVPSPGGMRILGMLADVSERRRILDERQRLEEELRRRVEELAAADRRKDEFLAMLAHELRNPLAAISNAGYVLGRKSSLDPRSTELLAMVSRQIRHLSRLVDDLLDVSRFSRGLIELRKTPMELRRAVEGAVETARPHIEQRRHTLKVALPDEPLWLEADVTRIEQVLANLLHNAAKFTPPGGLLQLTAEREEGEAMLRVRDNGAGISADLLPRIFDLFVQEERSLDRSQGGLGIGLTLVRSLVERHGGSVAVISEGPGSGTEFTVRLPLAEPPAETSDRLQEGPRKDAASRAIKVLLVEDNLDAAEALGELLRMWGHEVHIAHDGPSALRTAGEECPDVLLLDIGLPGMDGYEVARRLRSMPGLEGAKLIALTGYGQEADRQRATLAGFDHHLVKPVELERLRELLASAGNI